MSTTRLSAPARREQLLAVALEVFAASGYHGASMNDVAVAAGVTKPVLYQHFESKQALFDALVLDVSDRMLSAIVKATAEATDSKELTRQGFHAYFHWVRDEPAAFALLFGTGVRHDPEFKDTVQALTRSAADAIAPLITVEIGEEHRRNLAHAIVGLVEGVSRHLLASGGDFDADEVADQVTDLAWAGLRAVHADR